jgi:DNA-binding HxlR family transcriptional regulator
MTRAHAIRQLLRHGDMTVNDLADCTRWSRRALWKTLDGLQLSGCVVRHGYTFGLSNA